MPTPIRNKVIKIRLTDDEFAELNKRKTRPELARWLREIGLGIEQSKSYKKNHFPVEVMRILAGMGNNLNQIAKQLNSTAKINVIDPVIIIKATIELNAMERNLNALRDYLINAEREKM